MKKVMMALISLLVIFTMAIASANSDTVINPIPDEISALFDVPAWKGYSVPRSSQSSNTLAWCYDEAMDAGLVVQSNGNLHVLCLIERDSKGILRITARNYTIITGNSIPTIEIGEGATSHELAVGWNVPMFELHGCSGYYIAIGEFNGIWRIKTVLD